VGENLCLLRGDLPSHLTVDAVEHLLPGTAISTTIVTGKTTILHVGRANAVVRAQGRHTLVSVCVGRLLLAYLAAPQHLPLCRLR